MALIPMEFNDTSTGTLSAGTGITTYADWTFVKIVNGIATVQWRFTVGNADITVNDTVVGTLTGVKPSVGNIILTVQSRFGNNYDNALCCHLMIQSNGSIILVSSNKLKANETYVGSVCFPIA